MADGACPPVRPCPHGQGNGYFSGGHGGFGGGGGGGNGGGGGFGGGNGASGSNGRGGGGLAAGGDIFVQEGASLSIDSGLISAGTVTQGQGGPNPQVGWGQAFANGIYLQGNNTLTFSPTGTVKVAGVIGDDQGSAAAAHYHYPEEGKYFYNPGSVAIAIDGTGTVQLEATNTYTGSTTLSGTATLELGVPGAAGSGTIKFGSGTNTLQIDGTTMPTNTIDQFGAGGDVIDLRGLPFVAGATAQYDSSIHILTVTSNSITETLTLTNVASLNFDATNDGSGGTQVSPSLTTLVNFTVTDGAFPHGSLIADAAGNLFGTTRIGGTTSAFGQGTVFEIVKTTHGYASTPSTVVTFTGADGAAPTGSLIADAVGDLFRHNIRRRHERSGHGV